MPLFKAENLLLKYKNEHLLFFDNNGNLLENIRGNKGIVQPPEEIRKKYRGHICSHNHMKGNPHSPRDIIYATYWNMQQTRVVTPDKLFILYRPKKGWFQFEWNETIKPLFFPIYTEETGFSYDEKTGLSNAPDKWEFTDNGKTAVFRIWKRIFDDIGAEYIVESI